MVEIQFDNIKNKFKTIDLITTACRFKSDIYTENNGKKINMKSIMTGFVIDDMDNVNIFIDGVDETAAWRAINSIV